MRNIPYDDMIGLHLPHDIQLKRMRRVIASELTDIQREVILAYYFEEKTLTEIARERGIHKSTACRTLHRAEERLKRYLKY